MNNITTGIGTTRINA